MKKTENTNHWLDSRILIDAGAQALISSNGKLSYAELNGESLRAAAHLNSRGINKGDNVAILTGNSPEFVKIVLGIWYLGAVPVPVNTRNTTAEIFRQIEFAGCNTVIHENTLREKISPGFSGKKIELPLPSDFTFSEFTPAKFSADRNALIMFTSGTTGKLKAVVHTFESLYSGFSALDDRYSFLSSDIWLASLPFFHIGGFMIFVRSLLAGSGLLFSPSLKSSGFIEVIKYFQPQYFSVVTTNFKEMLSAGLKPYGGLKTVFLGGGPLEPALSISAVNSGWPVAHVYGSTETAAMVTVLDAAQVTAKPDSAGSPLKGNNIFIDEKSGEILVGSRALFKGYLNNEAETSNKIKNGFYHTGDLGRIDSEGFLYVEARREDIIISGGENVSVHEVRNALEMLPVIKEAAVFALDDEKWGQTVAAAVVPEKDAEVNETSLRQLLRDKIASYKIPTRFFFVKELPKSALGKIKTAELKKMLTQD